MIDPRELRLGNFVKTTVQAHPRFSDKVESIVSIELISKDYCVCKDTLEVNGVVVSNDYLQKNLSELKPIPLTDDILLKCGFERKENFCNRDHFCLYYNHFYIDVFHVNHTIQKYIWNMHIDDEYFMNVGYGHFDYLHELQNLFYDLTKTELNVQL